MEVYLPTGHRGARGSGVGVKGSGVGNPHPYPWAPLPLTPRGYPDPWNSLGTLDQSMKGDNGNQGWNELLDINHCCGIFTTLHKRKAHYSRVCSTIVPSVACQTTEGEYLLLTILSYLLIPCSYLQVYTNTTAACQTTEVTYRSPTPSFLQARPCADHHLSIWIPVTAREVRHSLREHTGMPDQSTKGNDYDQSWNEHQQWQGKCDLIWEDLVTGTLMRCKN